MTNNSEITLENGLYLALICSLSDFTEVSPGKVTCLGSNMSIMKVYHSPSVSVRRDSYLMTEEGKLLIRVQINCVCRYRLRAYLHNLILIKSFKS